MRVVTIGDVDRPFRSDLGEEIYELIGRPPELGGTVKHSFVHVVIPSGKSSPAHLHRESEETYYGLSGRAVMQINAHRFAVEPGIAVLIMPGEIHQIWNEGEANFEFLAVSAPAWVPGDTYPADLPQAPEK